MRDFSNLPDETLEGHLQEEGNRLGLRFVVEQRPQFEDDVESIVWFAALKDMETGGDLAPDGIAVYGTEQVTRRDAMVDLARWLDILPDTELRAHLALRRREP